MSWCLGLVIAMLLLTGCGEVRALVGQAAEPGEVDGDGAIAAQPLLANAGEVRSSLTAGAIDGDIREVLGDLGLTSDADGAERFREQLIESVLPPGAVADDRVVAMALAARLGPAYEGEADLAILIGALSSELGDGSSFESVDDLLQAVAAWADTGVIMFGPASDAVATITTSTTFDQATELIGQPGVSIDVLAGIGRFDIAGVTTSVDEAARQIRIDGTLGAPLSGSAIVTVTWSNDGPQLALDLVSNTIILGDLVPGAAGGEVGRVAASDVVLHLDANGFAATAQVVPRAIPGLEQLGLGAEAVPVEVVSAGFGPWAGPGAVEPVTVQLPLPGLPLLGEWNVARVGSVIVTLSSNPSIDYRETLTAWLGGEELVFDGAGTVGNDGVGVSLALEGDWVEPFGAPWLTLSDVELIVPPSGSEQSAVVSGGYTLAGKSGTLEFLLGSGDAATARATGTLDDLDATDLTAVARTLTGGDLLPQGVALPNDVLRLRDVVISFVADSNGDRVTLGATTELLDETADAVLSVVPAADGGEVAVLTVTPRDVALARLFPVLSGNDIVGGLRLPDSAIVFASRDVRAATDVVDPALVAALGSAASGEVRLPPGISLSAAVPAGVSPVIDELKETLGMDRAAPLRLSGTVPVAALRGGGGEFVLNAILPPMSPAGNPEWFVAAELALRITSESSVSIVGSMTLDMQGDIQTFEIGASIDRGVDGVSLAFVGRLGSVWESPFGVEWLTLNEVVLQLGFEPVRGVTIGFLGDIVVGSKDLRGAMAITVSPAGVPTNFAFQASSVEGVSLADIADLYALVSGQARPPVEAVLPAAEIRDIELRFAPVAQPELGIEQGFQIAGEFWMASSIGGPLELITAVDVEISERGVIAEGFLTDFALGPVVFDESRLSVVLTAAEQRVSFSGGVTVAGSEVQIVLGVSRTEMAFATTGNFGGSQATLEIAASYDLTNPSWSVRAVMNDQFIRDLDTATERLLGAEISDLNSQIDTARTGLTAAQVALDLAEGSLRVAQTLVGPTCFGPFLPLCTAVDDAQRDVDNNRQRVEALRAELDRGEALLEQYDVQLTVVGAEFEVGFGALGSNAVSMELIVDANGLRVPVPIDWDFSKTIDANLDGLLDQIVANT